MVHDAPRFLASSEGLTWTSSTVMVIGGEGCGANLDVKCRTSVLYWIDFHLIPCSPFEDVRQTFGDVGKCSVSIRWCACVDLGVVCVEH